MTQKSNAFSGFTFEKPVVETLKEGTHNVFISSTSVTDSFHLLDGSVKEGLVEKIDDEEHWSDSTPQLAVVFVSKDGNGVFTYRFNAMGYKKVDDFSAEELEKDKYTVIKDYVCVRNKQKKLVRIESEKRTSKAHRMLNQFLFATGAKEGQSLDDILEACIADKTALAITIKKGQYEDKDTYDVAKFATVGEAAPASEGIDDDF